MKMTFSTLVVALCIAISTATYDESMISDEQRKTNIIANLDRLISLYNQRLDIKEIVDELRPLIDKLKVLPDELKKNISKDMDRIKLSYDSNNKYLMLQYLYWQLTHDLVSFEQQFESLIAEYNSTIDFIEQRVGVDYDSL